MNDSLKISCELRIKAVYHKCIVIITALQKVRAHHKCALVIEDKMQ